MMGITQIRTKMWQLAERAGTLIIRGGKKWILADGSGDMVVGSTAGCFSNMLMISFEFLLSIILKVQHGKTH